MEQEKNPDARDLVMRGWAWFYRPVSEAQQQEAQRAFEQALRRTLDRSTPGLALHRFCLFPGPPDLASRVNRIKHALSNCFSKLSNAAATTPGRF